MRRRTLVIGVVILAAGFVLAYVPGPSAEIPGGAQTVAPGTSLTFGGLPLAFLTPSVGWHAAWPPSAEALVVTVYVFSCGTDSSCGGVDPTNQTPVVQVDGASGGASWSGSAGQYFALYATDSVNVTLSYQAPLFGGLLGLLLIGVGAAVTVIGAVTRGPLPPASPPSPPSDETPPPAVRP